MQYIATFFIYCAKPFLPKGTQVVLFSPDLPPADLVVAAGLHQLDSDGYFNEGPSMGFDLSKKS